VVVNYNKLDIIDPAREVDVHVYKVIIKSASYKVKVDAEGNKMQDPTNANRPWREFVARSTSVNADDTFKKRFFSSMKPWRIYKQLVEDHEEFDLFVSYHGLLFFSLFFISATHRSVSLSVPQLV